jgi:hypothetical protein
MVHGGIVANIKVKLLNIIENGLTLLKLTPMPPRRLYWNLGEIWPINMGLTQISKRII